MASSDSQGGDSGYVAGDSNQNTSPDTYSPHVHQQLPSRREHFQKNQQRGDTLSPAEESTSSLKESKMAGDGGYSHEQGPCCSKSNLATTLGNSTSEDADDEGDVRRTIKELKDIKVFIEEIDAARRRGIRRSAPIQAPGPHMGMQQMEFPQAGTAYVPSLRYLHTPGSSAASERNQRDAIGESARATGHGDDQKKRESSGADSQSSGNLFRMSM